MHKHPGPWRHLIRTGDAVVLYYSQTRSRQEAGLVHFREVRAKEAIMARTKTQERAGGMRAAIYARVSDKSQDAEDKTSISEQISDMEAYCERRGLTITARYQEVGRGWSKKRPEFQRMLADARRERFDTLRPVRGVLPRMQVLCNVFPGQLLEGGQRLQEPLLPLDCHGVAA